MVAIRQESRKQPLEVGNFNRSTTSGGYTCNSAASYREQNCVIPVPCRTEEGAGETAQRLRWASSNEYLFELALRDKTDVTAVGKPEGVERTLCSRNPLSLECV